MKKLSFKTFLTAAALLPALFPAAAGDAVTVNAVKNGKTEWAVAQKIFTENDPAIVFQLKNLDKNDVARAFALPDVNRSTFGAVKSAAEDEYHYTLDSAADQAAKEEEKTKAGGADEKAGADSRIDTKTFGTSAFYAVSAGGNLSFVFKNSNQRNGVYEIVLEPMDQARFGRQGLHFLYEQGSGAVQTLNWTPRGSGNARVLYKCESRPTPDYERITVINIPWSSFYTLTGDIPVRAKSSVWKLGVYRWGNGEGQSLGGIPHEAADTYLVIPPVSARDIDNIKRTTLEQAVVGFYHVDQKKGNYTNGYFGFLLSQYRSLPFWKERFGVIYRLGFPLTFSEYYMPGLKRIVPKDEFGMDENAAKKEDEPGWRIREFQENMELLGNFIKANASNELLIDAMIRCDLEKFALPDTNFEKLRIEAIRNRIFSDKFLDEE